MTSAGITGRISKVFPRFIASSLLTSFYKHIGREAPGIETADLHLPMLFEKEGEERTLGIEDTLLRFNRLVSGSGFAPPLLPHERAEMELHKYVEKGMGNRQPPDLNTVWGFTDYWWN